MARGIGENKHRYAKKFEKICQELPTIYQEGVKMGENELSTCPYCGEKCYGAREEIAHMDKNHPEIIDQRLIDSGFRKEGDKWIDTLESNDG